MACGNCITFYKVKWKANVFKFLFIIKHLGSFYFVKTKAKARLPNFYAIKFFTKNAFFVKNEIFFGLLFCKFYFFIFLFHKNVLNTQLYR